MAEVAREPKKKTKRYRALRMNLYFLIVFLLFTALIFKLGIVQIVEGDKHRQDAEKANAKPPIIRHRGEKCMTSGTGWRLITGCA